MTETKTQRDASDSYKRPVISKQHAQSLDRLDPQSDWAREEDKAEMSLSLRLRWRGQRPAKVSGQQASAF